jgi:integrase
MGELLALRAGDFDARSKTLLIADSKSGKPRRVPLTDQGVALFNALTAGRSHDTCVFTRSDGSRWYRIAIGREIRAACEDGRINPPATFHTLRHTYASHLVQEGVPLLFVASALGHGDARMVEKHYGHLAPSAVAEMIRAKLPSFGEEAPAKVRSIRAARRE